MGRGGAAFTGFPPEALRLLRALAGNNDRTWFAQRKERYGETVVAPMRAYLDATNEALSRARIPIYGTPERSIFRVYRDVRFSPDKRPYKTHAAAYLSRDGGRQTQGGLYLHVEPRNSFLGIAFYLIPPPLLYAWRRAIVDDPAAWQRIVRGLERRGYALEPDEDGTLARVPRGFEPYRDAPFAEYLKYRSFTVHRPLDDRDVQSPELVRISVGLVKDALPLLRFGWTLDDALRAGDEITWPTSFPSARPFALR